MERHVVVGTAGHIDHGKTTLVKALTGVDTDRLAEEKARGITIDLGFAPLALDGAHASVVDVPGHEGFIRNMVAGATGVDLALLVVAADEGVMPQTREHLAILRYLGVTRGVVALTKADLAVDAAWRELVAEDVGALVRECAGTDWPIVTVSAATGDGIEALRAELSAAARGLPPRAADDAFRLPVDRVFALAGAGTVVTGTVWSGAVREGESVTVLPANRTGRVRSVQVHGHAASAAEPGRRAALALTGVAREDAPRGAVVVAGAGWETTSAIDVAVRFDGATPPRLRQRVRVHHGTADVMARVARIGVAVDGEVPLRLRLDEPIVARAGDRLVLRSPSPVATIGGGVVTDPATDRIARARRRLEPPLPPADGDAALLARLVTRRGGDGLARADAAIACGFTGTRLAAAAGYSRALGIVERDGWLVASAEIETAAARLLAALDAFHASHPLEPGMSLQAWRGAAHATHPGLLALVEAKLDHEKAVERTGSLVRRPGWDPGASAEGHASQHRVLELLTAAGAEPPSAAEVAAALPGIDVPAALRLLARGGRIVPVADRYYEKDALDAERRRLAAILQELGSATPAAIRERLGRSRKWLIPLLEWADREGLTVRDGDRRALRNATGA